ncbi:hypothetical protein INR49_028061 [Caranx melampygus]|nr:hypothetical protein INR49_028061 [Caranx melampygus]
MTWRQAGSERLELIGRQKYEGVEGAGGIVYELSEVDHHRGSQAKANGEAGRAKYPHLLLSWKVSLPVSRGAKEQQNPYSAMTD